MAMKPRTRNTTTCHCQTCGIEFLIDTSFFKRGRGKYCTLACSRKPVSAKSGLTRRVPLADRFWPKVAVAGPNDCWEWLAFKEDGYGRIDATNGGTKKQIVGAHRVSYEIAHGAIPDGLTVLHACDNRGCVNPAHLSLGTNADNNLDRDTKGRTARGEQNGKSKLTPEKVRVIREGLRMGRSCPDLGKEAGVTAAAVMSVKIGKTWRHVQ